MNHPWLLLLMTAAGLYVAKLWRDDCAAMRAGKTRPGMLPGVTPAPPRALVIAVLGALGLLALETIGEIALGLSDQQMRMTWFFALYSVLGAPVIEEVIFRGWLTFDRHGRRIAWAGAIAASIVFALLHLHLFRWGAPSGFAFTPEPKAWFSTGALFVTSLWLYAARLGSWNPQRSLLPCFVAHAVRNAGVVAIKASLGFMGAA